MESASEAVVDTGVSRHSTDRGQKGHHQTVCHCHGRRETRLILVKHRVTTVLTMGGSQIMIYNLFKIAIQIGKFWKILENCQNFRLAILQKFPQQSWSWLTYQTLTQIEKNFMQNYCTEFFHFSLFLLIIIVKRNDK